MNNSIIKQVETGYYQVPLREPVWDAMHGLHTHFELITVTITTEDGVSGCGYTYTGGVGGKAIYSMVEDYLKPSLIGEDADRILHIWKQLFKKTHYIGRGGIETFAISAVDIALWDVQCKRSNLPLWKAVGGSAPCTKTYVGGIDLGYDLDKLVASSVSYLDQGYLAAKIKVGKDNIYEDLERVKAVKAVLGDKPLMVDANYKWNVAEAIQACQLMKDYIFWMEEPVSPDDIEGYKAVGQLGGVPIAGGENLHSIYEFDHLLRYGYCNYLQPDPSNVGGITGWLKVATLAEQKGIPVCSHGMQELCVSLMSGRNNGGWLEVHSFYISDYTLEVPDLREGQLYAPTAPGIGVTFDWNKLDPFQKA